MLRKFLVPVDGSELSDRVLAHVPQLASREGEVTLAHVIGESPLRANAQEILDERLRRLAAEGVRARSTVLVGDAAAKIVEHAAEHRTSLIAMSTHGSGGELRWIRGSVAERLVRASPCPLLLWNAREVGQERTPRRIVVPVDPLDQPKAGSPILPLVLELARRLDCEVLLLAVIDDRLNARDPLARRSDAERWLDACHRLLNGVPALTRVVTGSPPAEVLNAAESDDLIAITSHTGSSASPWLQGSVVEHVVRQCSSSLLLLRPRSDSAQR